MGVPSALGVMSGEGCAPFPEFFLNFYIKIVSCAPKNTKMHQKLLKEIARRLRCFYLVHFRTYSLKIFEGGGLGAWPPIAPDYAAVQTTRCINFSSFTVFIPRNAL